MSRYSELIWEERAPGVSEYLRLREACGMMPRRDASAETGLANSLYVVTVRTPKAELIGMGRVVGDGACFFQIVDIMVSPERQGEGIGTEMMERIMSFLGEAADAQAHVNLFATPRAVPLYERFGFQLTDGIAMGMDIPREHERDRPEPGLLAFERLDMRVGTIRKAEEFPEARTPAYKLFIDFGDRELKSSARITALYPASELEGRQVVCAVNLGERQIGPFRSQCRVLGIERENGEVVLLEPERPVEAGSTIS